MEFEDMVIVDTKMAIEKLLQMTKSSPKLNKKVKLIKKKYIKTEEAQLSGIIGRDQYLLETQIITNDLYKCYDAHNSSKSNEADRVESGKVRKEKESYVKISLNIIISILLIWFIGNMLISILIIVLSFYLIVTELNDD